jgi:hypothetical protein
VWSGRKRRDGILVLLLMTWSAVASNSQPFWLVANELTLALVILPRDVSTVVHAPGTT